MWQLLLGINLVIKAHLADVAGSGEGEVQRFGANRGATALCDPRDWALPAAAARGALHAPTIRPRGAVLPNASQGKISSTRFQIYSHIAFFSLRPS